MRVWTFTHANGSESLLTQYDTGEMTLAVREDTRSTWGPPIHGVLEEYDYRTERRIEDVVTRHGWVDAEEVL